VFNDTGTTPGETSPAGKRTTFDVQRAVMASKLPAPARLVMHTLCATVDFTTLTTPAEYAPSLTKLAEMTGLVRSTVAKELNRLEADGWVVRERPTVAAALAKQARTCYRVTIPAAAEAPEVGGVGASCPQPLGAHSPQVEAECPQPETGPNVGGSSRDGRGVVRSTDWPSLPGGLVSTPVHTSFDTTTRTSTGVQSASQPAPGGAPTSTPRPSLRLHPTHPAAADARRLIEANPNPHQPLAAHAIRLLTPAIAEARNAGVPDDTIARILTARPPAPEKITTSWAAILRDRIRRQTEAQPWTDTIPRSVDNRWAPHHWGRDGHALPARGSQHQPA
jgi:biotin operon repressor